MRTACTKSPIGRRRRDGGGITLVELLVAISIIVLLLGLAAHTLNLSVDDRRVREAARSVNVFLGSARTRALETGRPCGVMLRRLEGQPRAAIGMDLVEVPPPYAGDTMNAAAKLHLDGAAGSVTTVSAKFRPGDFGDRLVREHDRIQFNYQGPWYEIHGGPDTSGSGYFNFDLADIGADGFSNSSLTLEIELNQGQRLPWPSGSDWSQPVPFQIVRRPMKSATETLQLPLRTVIDLQYSGGEDHQFVDIAAPTSEPIIILFAADGSLDRVYHGAGHGHAGMESLFLLVGKQNRVVPTDAEDGLSNWQDLGNMWVSFSRQTGLVRTSEMAPVTSGNWQDSREFARGAESVGGR